MEDPNRKGLRRFKGKFEVLGFCETCNTGWMSEAENVAKPLLIDLMLGKDVLLTKRMQRTLSRWIALKTLVFSLATPDMDLPRLIFRQCFRQNLGGITVHLTASNISTLGGRAVLRGIRTEGSTSAALNSTKGISILVTQSSTSKQSGLIPGGTLQ